MEGMRIRLGFLWVVALTCRAAFADSAVVWRHEPTVSLAPDACVEFGRVTSPFATESVLCPDPQGALVIQGATPFPTLLAQTSAHGGLVRYSAGVPSTSIPMPFMAQPLAARQLADGSTAILSVDLELQPSSSGLFRAHLSLMDIQGALRWTIPIGGLRTQSDRAARAGFVAELSAGGDLVALVNNGWLQAVRVRRSDGRIEAYAETSGAGLGSEGLVNQPAGIYSSVPFTAWIGQDNVYVANDYALQTLNSTDMQTRAYMPWRDLFADSSIVARAFQPAATSDGLFVLVDRLSAIPPFHDCQLLRVSATVQVVWDTLISDCTADGFLEMAGPERLVFTGHKSGPVQIMAIADVQAGAIEREIPLTAIPKRLASTGSVAAYLSQGPEVGQVQVTGLRLADGAQLYRQGFDFPSDVDESFPARAQLPNLISDGTSVFAVQYGRSDRFRSLGFVAHVIDANTGAASDPIEPNNIDVSADVSILGRSGKGLILGTTLTPKLPWQGRIEGVDGATGERIWARNVAAQSPDSFPNFQVNDQRVLIAEGERLTAPERWRLRAQVVDALTGADVFLDTRELSPPPPTFSSTSFLGVTLTPENYLIYAASNSGGMHAIGLAPSGQPAWDVVHADVSVLTRTDRGRQLVVINPTPGEASLAAVNAVDGSLIQLGAWQGDASINVASDVGVDHRDLWMITVRRNPSGVYIFTVQRRTPGHGLVWSREIVSTTPNPAIVFANAEMEDGSLAFTLRNVLSSSSNTVARTLRLDGATGATVWDQSQSFAPRTSTGCRQFSMASNGDLLCAESYGEVALEFSAVANAQTYVRRMNPTTGELRGVHWLAIESDTLRGLFREDGPSTRSFRAEGELGFAFTGPAAGARPYTTAAVGRIREPIDSISGDLRVTGAPAANGARFRLHNESNALAADVQWTVDVSGQGAIESIDCSPEMMAGAQIRVYGARGAFDLEPGATTECVVHWLQSVPGEMRKASLYAWPAFDYLDRDPGNNVAVAVGAELFMDDFE